jgi:FkbM family methyltransferase
MFGMIAMIKKVIKYLLMILNYIIRRSNYIRFPIFGGSAYIYSRYNKTIIRVRTATEIDITTLDHVFGAEQYDLRKFQHYAELMKWYDSSKEKLILDCGANIGCSALYFKDNFPEANIVAVEPIRENYNIMQSNLSEHNDIQGLNKAIGAKEGFVSIIDPTVDNNATQVRRAVENGNNEIEVVSIPSLLKKNGVKSAFIVKIDIEGFEDDLFSENLDWIDMSEVIIIELHDWLLPWQQTSKNFIKAIANRDRDLLIDGENLISIKVRK